MVLIERKKNQFYNMKMEHLYQNIKAAATILQNAGFIIQHFNQNYSCYISLYKIKELMYCNHNGY